MQLKDLTITALGKGLYSCECAPDDAPDEPALPQTAEELQALLDRAKAGEDVRALPKPRRDLFGAMQYVLLNDSAWGREWITDLWNGEAPHVLMFQVVNDKDGGASIKVPLSDERKEAIRKNAPKEARDRAEVAVAAVGEAVAEVQALGAEAGALVGAFTDLNALVVNASTAARVERIHKSFNSRLSGVNLPNSLSLGWADLFQFDGVRGGGVRSGGLANPTNTTAGSFLQTDPTGGYQKWLTMIRQFGYCSAFGCILLYDCLLHCGGLSGTSTSAQTVGGTISRNTGGEGNEMWAFASSDIGASGQTCTVSYHDEANAARTSTFTIGGSGSNRQGWMMRIPFSTAAGQWGVRTIDQVQLAGSTGTAGNWGVMIAKPLMLIPLEATDTTTLNQYDMIEEIVECETDACWCLGAFVNGNGTASWTETMFQALFVEA